MTRELKTQLEKYISEQRWKELNNAEITFDENCLTFEIKEYHLLLMKEFNLHLVAQGGYENVITTDSKRPYGNSDMHSDILAYLSGKSQDDFIDFDGDGEFFPEFQTLLEEKPFILETIHNQMSKVLQIVCATLTVELGTYQRTAFYKSDWKKIK